MSKRLLITEEEKKEIKKLYKIEEGWIEDAITYLKDKGESLVDFVSDLFGDDEDEEKEKEKEEEKEKSEKEKEKDAEKKIKDLEGKDREEFKKEVEKQKFEEERGKWSTFENYLYFVPESKTEKVHVLFGGVHTTTNPSSMTWYKSHIPKSVLNKSIFIITNYRNTIEKAEIFVEEHFGKKITSLAGFSQGGVEAWKAANSSKYDLVGLIDPSTENKHTSVIFGPNTYMVCRPNNWGGKEYTLNVRRLMREHFCAERKGKYNGHVICMDKKDYDNYNVTHEEFLDFFYEKYGSKI
jgi:hypothetical protein